jgi:hypothetical protein
VDAGAEIEDRLGGAGVDGAGELIREVMGEVGADDDEGLGASPERFDDAGDVLRVGVADGEGDEGEVIAERADEERELDLEGVLAEVGGGAAGDPGDAGDGGGIDGDAAQGAEASASGSARPWR